MIDELDPNPYSITVVGEYAGLYNDIYAKIIDALQNDGFLPNVVVAYPNSFADFARYGGVRFLDDYYNDPTIGITDTTDFYPGVLNYYQLGEYGGRLAGIQNGRSIEVMYYNADLLAAVGLDLHPNLGGVRDSPCPQHHLRDGIRNHSHHGYLPLCHLAVVTWRRTPLRRSESR